MTFLLSLIFLLAGIGEGQTAIAQKAIGQADLNPVQNLTWVIDGDKIILSWNPPAKNVVADRSWSKDKNETVLLLQNLESTQTGAVPSGWTVLDVDGDGKTWRTKSDEQTQWITPHSGHKVLASFSWDGAPLTPDNYLISPDVTGATKVKYYYAVNKSFAAEHYVVMASSTGTDISDFSVVFEETPTASQKGGERRAGNASEGPSKEQSEWIERIVTLPLGTKYVAFRHNATETNNYILLDDISFLAGEVSEYTYTVYRNGVQLASGLYTSTYEDSGLANGTYNYCVQVQYAAGLSPLVCEEVPLYPIFPPVAQFDASAEGYVVNLTWTLPTDTDTKESGDSCTYTLYRDGLKIAEGLAANSFQEERTNGTYNYCIEVQYAAGTSTQKCDAVTVNHLPPVENLKGWAEGNTVILRWEPPQTVFAPDDVVLNATFDEGLPADWTAVDADGDGYGWQENLSYGHTVGCMTSASYLSGVGALTPDNYLITPALALSQGGRLEYWVSTQHTAHPYEHYAVYASTTGNAPSDFTILLHEELLTSKKDGVDEAVADRTQGAWLRRILQLPAGTKYIAFRHFDCTDMYRFNVDDVRVVKENNSLPPYTYTVYRDGSIVAEGLTATTYSEEAALASNDYCVEVVYPSGGVSLKKCVSFNFDVFPPASEFTATQPAGTMDAILTWKAPEGGLTPFTYTLYRNGEEIASQVTETTYCDADLAVGSYTFGLKVVYSYADSETVTTHLSITSLGDVTAPRPYSLAVIGSTISICGGDSIALFDLNGRCLAISSGGGAVDYVVPSGAYTVRIEVDGQVYVEKVIVK